jgi:hypothetical protein
MSVPQQHLGRRAFASSFSRTKAAYVSGDEGTFCRSKKRAYADSSKISRNAAQHKAKNLLIIPAPLPQSA